MADEKNQGNSEYDDKMKQLALKKAEAELQDLEERLAEREMKRENRRQRSLTNGVTLRQISDNEKSTQDRCNHQKGGNGAEGFVGGQGDDSQKAVLKHRMPNGDVWVRCLRCGKTWKPPLEEQFTTKGRLNEEAFKAAQQAYETAVAFQTRNQMSGAVQFRFSDGGKYFRKMTKETTMR